MWFPNTAFSFRISIRRSGITRRGGGAEGAEYHVLGERRTLGGIAALAVGYAVGGLTQWAQRWWERSGITQRARRWWERGVSRGGRGGYRKAVS